LQALAGQEFAAHEVLVIDNAPQNRTSQEIAHRHGARYYVEPVLGVSRARNLGARQAVADYVAYIDDDMVPHPRWLAEIMSGFATPGIGAVTGPVLSMDLSKCDDTIVRHAATVCSPGGVPFTVSKNSPEWFERANFGGIGDGNMAFRRAALAEINGFEERIGRGMPIEGGEEHYAFFCLLAAGGEVAYRPGAVVFHANPTMTADLVRRSIALNAAYACLLIERYPRFAVRLLRFFLEGASQKKRPWRHSLTPSDTVAKSHVPLLQKVASFLAGIKLYRQQRRSVADKKATALPYAALPSRE
jgi:glycosyltransferase involved in cell wall biosynthesis